MLNMAAFRYSLPVLKIYNARYVYYRFLLAVNIETQPMYTDLYTCYLGCVPLDARDALRIISFLFIKC